MVTFTLTPYQCGPGHWITQIFVVLSANYPFVQTGPQIFVEFVKKYIGYEEHIGKHLFVKGSAT